MKEANETVFYGLWSNTKMSMTERVLKSMMTTELFDWYNNVKVEGAASRRILEELKDRTDLTEHERMRLYLLVTG